MIIDLTESKSRSKRQKLEWFIGLFPPSSVNLRKLVEEVGLDYNVRSIEMIIDALVVTEEKAFSVTKSCSSLIWRSEEWKYHRVDGPAIEGCDLDGKGDGTGLFYWHGENLTMHQHACLIKSFSAKKDGLEHICDCLDSYIIDYDTSKLSKRPGCWHLSSTSI